MLMIVHLLVRLHFVIFLHDFTINLPYFLEAIEKLAINITHY